MFALCRAQLLLAGLACATAVWASEPAPPDPEAPTSLSVVPPASLVEIDLLEVVVTGNTVLDAETVHSVVEPFLGPGRHLDDVDTIRETLENTYRDRGYKTVSVRIPQQVARDGIVRLEVIEARVGRLNVTGSRYHSLERIKMLAPSVAVGTVPNFERVQGDLVALNSVPDLRVSPALTAGLRPNTFDVDLAVDDSLPLHGTFEVNNRHSQDTAPLRSQIGMSYGDLWQRSHSLSLTYQVAPEDPEQSQVFVGTYLARFEASPVSLLANYIRSDSAVSTIGGINVLGNGEIVGLRLFVPIDGTENVFPTATLGVDCKRFRNRTALPDSGQGEQSFATPVTYYPFSAGLGALWRGEQSTTRSDASLNYSSPQLGSDTAELDDSRYRARGQQFSFRASLGHVQDYPLGFQTSFRFATQLTDQPLIGTEQFSAGGAESVRGYLESAALGDQGFSGSVELHYPALLSAIPYASRTFSELDLYVFADEAQLKLRDPLPDQATDFHLSSWGAALHYKVRSLVDATLQWAQPLRALPGKDLEPGRLLFRLASTF